MSQTLTKLALDGGSKAIDRPLPGTLHGVLEIGEAEIEAVTKVLRRRTMFRFLNPPEISESSQLEAKYRAWCGVPYALAVGGGGTSALICALVGLGVGSGDEVIVPGYTYIATAAACLSVGAIPVLAEVNDSLTIDARSIEANITEHTRAVIPVHMRGTPADMDAVMAVARAHNLKVLEDVAQANGGMYKGRPLGSIGDAGAFSMQHYKVITASEGGIVTAKDEQVFKRAAIKHDSAMQFWQSDATWPSFAGENYRMDEMRAALGLVQFSRMPGILERCRGTKRALIAGTRELELLSQQPMPCGEGDCGIAFHLFARSAEAAQRFSEALAAEGVPCATIYNKQIPDRHIYTAWDYVMQKGTGDPTGWPWTAAHREIAYRPDMLPRTLGILGRCISIGLNQQWQASHVEQVVRAIRKVYDALASRGNL